MSEQRFTLGFPVEPKRGPWEPWIAVLAGDPRPVPYPFEIRLRYSPKGELLCAGLRIGEGSSVGAGSDEVPKIREDGKEALIPRFAPREPSNITRRMLQAIPLGEVLRYIQYVVFEDPDPLARSYADWLLSNVALVAPPKGRTASPGTKGHPDEVYIEAARLFLECGGGEGNNRAAYQKLAGLLHCDDSTARRHVKRGWALQPDLEPKDVRTRRVDGFR